ncbi:MAG: nucleotidyl transferase AbiEii/AbiGii toxin family protein [Campylobacter sp.]|nr:nucleotidyl transferase AbiEii/AbiGii toxin family protein [Campylobacter sp.]
MNYINLSKLADNYSQDLGVNLKSVIIKEMLHLDILKALSDCEISKQIAFQGGTALRLCYQGARYCEDLNFVLCNESLDFDKELFREFEEAFIKSIKDKYNLEIELIYPKNDENIVQKWIAKINLPIENRKEGINIEVCKIPSYDNKIKNIRNYYNPKHTEDIFLRVESLDEILADKIIAFGAREYIKYRDLWDIKFLKDRNIILNNKFVENKINDYKISDFDKLLDEKLYILNNEDLKENFFQEMSRFLKPKLLNKLIELDYFSDIKKEINQLYDEFKNNQNHKKINKKK